MLVFILAIIFGLALYVIILSILAYFSISMGILIIISISSGVVLIFGLLKKKLHFGTFKLSKNIPLLIIFLFCSIYVGYYLLNCPWHPADDAKLYGFLTSLLSFNNKNTGTFLPYSSTSLYWEAGVSVLSTYLAKSGGIMNGRAIMVAGALVVALIPSLIYAIAFSHTKKHSLSALAALCSFNVYFLPYGLSFWSRFFTGNYGALFGILFLYLYIWIISNLTSRKETCFFYVTLFPLLASFFVYSGYLLPMFLFNLFIIGTRFVKIGYVRIDSKIRLAIQKFSLQKDIKITLVLMLLITVFLGLLFVKTDIFPKGITQVFWPILEKFSMDRHGSLPQSINNASYSLNLSFFGYGLESIIMIPILIIALFGVYKWKTFRTNFTKFYIFLSSVVLFYALSGLTTALIFNPKRLALALFPLTWIMLILLAYYFLSSSPLHRLKWKNALSIKFKGNRLLRSNFVILLAIILASSTLLPHITFSFARTNSYYVYSSYFEPSFKSALWINEHVSSSDLILNDMSFGGYFLLSMNIFNLTYADPITYFPEYQERGKALWTIWTDPLNETNVRDKLLAYNVSYIMSDADYKFFSVPFFDPLTKYGWTPKTYQPSEIAEIFDSYPFLEKVFEYGDARIYRVDADQLNSFGFVERSIIPAGDKSLSWSTASWGEGTIGAPLISGQFTENESLKIEFPSGTERRASCSLQYNTSQDWSSSKYIVVDLYGAFTNRNMELLLSGSSGKTQAWNILDNFSGWKKVFIPLDPQKGWKDYLKTGFPDLTDITKVELRFTPSQGDNWVIKDFFLLELRERANQ